MRYLKTLGLAVIAAAALMALVGAGTASATELCSSNTSPCTGTMYPAGTEIEAGLTGTAKLETTGGTTLDECNKGGVEGTTSNTGGSKEAETVKGTVAASGLTWEECTFITTTTTGGELEIHTDTAGVPNGNGTLTARGFVVSIPTIFGTCTYGFGTTAHDLGTLKGGTGATIEINTLVPRISGPCPAEARWKANYKVVKPASLFVE